MAKLKNAYLIGAKLEGANLKEANLEGANLQGSQHLSLDQLSKVKTLHDTKLDEGLQYTIENEVSALFDIP